MFVVCGDEERIELPTTGPVPVQFGRGPTEFTSSDPIKAQFCQSPSGVQTCRRAPLASCPKGDLHRCKRVEYVLTLDVQSQQLQSACGAGCGGHKLRAFVLPDLRCHGRAGVRLVLWQAFRSWLWLSVFL